MTLLLITEPSEEPISLADLTAHARIDGGDENELIEFYITAARQKLDGRDGLLGRALVTQQWQLRLDTFPAGIVVPLPPCQSVDSITYIDAAGDQQTLAASGYTVSGIGSAHGTRIQPSSGSSWPTTKDIPEAVTVNFTAGYGAAADVPEPIREAIRLWAAHLYDERHAVVVAGSMREMPMGVHDLIADYRVWSF